MSIHYTDLNPLTRKHMVDEIQSDIESTRLYYSSRFSPNGRAFWAPLLIEAAKEHDDGWLADQLTNRGCFLHYVQDNRTGKLRKVPSDAAELLADGEFNRFYARGLCLNAITRGIPHVQVYRGKEVSQPRPESERLIGTKVPVEALLNDLRIHVGIETALGLAQPNSGLTIRIPNN